MKIIEDLNENSARCLYILLHNGADPSEIIDTEGDTLLHFCAKKGLYDALNILIVAGANIESINTIV
jgi:ankyrin repeat protein